MLLWILLLTLLGGVLSALVAGLLTWVPAGVRARVLPSLVSYAVGTMLAVVCLELLPRLYHDHRDTPGLGLALLGGVLLFFLLEKAVLWRHAHPGGEDAHPGPGPVGHAPAGTLILIGDSVHNFVDGVLIASAALTDPVLGLVTAVAVFAHEIPQEVGDVIVLLHSGYGTRRAFGYNLLSNLATVVGGLGAALAFGAVAPLVPYALAIAAASFLYVAVADLIPALHRHASPRAVFGQAALIALGVATVLALEPLVQAPLRHAH
jgi:zinc and cadmium transporter